MKRCRVLVAGRLMLRQVVIVACLSIRVAAESPAAKLGIKLIDVSGAGPHPTIEK